MSLNPVLFLLLIALFSTFSILPSPAFSRGLPSQTTLFDVSASLHQANQVLKAKPELLEEGTYTILNVSPSSPSSSFSLDLHSRDSLLNVHHQDYNTLVMSRLARDSDRVNSITNRVQLALTQDNRTDDDTDPTRAEAGPPGGFSTPIFFDFPKGYGEYLSRVGIGEPPKLFYMVLDTGSDVNWIQCKPCTKCYSQPDPIYDPAKSSSYSPLACDSPQCSVLDSSSCPNGKCSYKVVYGDGSITIGEYAIETLSFENSGFQNRVAMGCGHDNRGLFIGLAGVLGLGGGPLSFTSQIKATSFSYCLVDRDSGKLSTLEFNSSRLGDDSVTTELMRNRRISTFYYIKILGVTIGGITIPFPPASSYGLGQWGSDGTIVDSGTSVSRIESGTYESMRDVFKSKTGHLKSARGVDVFDTCYDLSSVKTARVPTMSFQLGGGKTLELPAKNYVVPVNTKGTFCFAFAPTTMPRVSILGNMQMQGMRITIDIANNRVGFSPNKC